MVMVIDVLMKYVLRFLHSLLGCVPVDIKDCSVVSGWGFGGEIEVVSGRK